MGKITIMLFSLALFCSGCVTPRPTVPSVPDWYENPPNSDAEYWYAVDVGESRDMSLATQKAKARCLATFTQQMGTRVDNLVKLFQEDVGRDESSEILEKFSSVLEAVASATLRGVSEERKESQQLPNALGTYRVYVLMSLPIGEANEKTMAEINADAQLYTRFRASKAHEDLNKKIKAYEEARNNP